MAPELVVIGALIIDKAIDHRHQNGELPGGAVLFSSLAAAIVGVKTGIVSVVGKDYPQSALDAFVQHDIQLEGLHEINGPCCRCHIYEAGKLRYFKHPEGFPSFEDICPHIEHIPQPWLHAKGVHLAPVVNPHQIELMIYLRKHVQGTISVDPVEVVAQRDLPRFIKALSLADYVIPSQAEFEVILDHENYHTALKKLVSNDTKYVILKRGINPMVLYNVELKAFSTYKIHVSQNTVDTTGAGDSFCGAFHAAMLKFNNVNVAIKLGMTMSSFTVEDHSARRLFALSSDEFYDRAKKLYPEIADFLDISLT